MTTPDLFTAYAAHTAAGGKLTFTEFVATLDAAEDAAVAAALAISPAESAQLARIKNFRSSARARR